MPETRVVSPIPPSSVTADPLTGADTLDEVELEALLETGTTMWAVVFAGGIGTRFWPLSTPRRPKQVLALVNERPLIADTIARLSPLVPAERVLVVTSADIADTLYDAIPEVPRANMLVEPRPLGTAAALAWGAQEVSRRAGPDTVFVALHADLAVGYPDILRDTLRRAASIALADKVLVTIGAQPTRPETGFGYLQPGMPIDPLVSRAEGGACRVEHFVEKPSAALADVLIDKGALWNSGIFVWRARVVLDELEQHTAELQHGLPKLAAGEMAAFAELVTSVSIDRGLLERSPNVVVLPAAMEWDDVGTWASLRRVRELDDTGNGVMGDVHCVDCSGNVIHADGCCVVAYGISGMIVVSIDGLTFVTTQDRATELGPMLNALPGSLRFNPGRH
ncbi:mannose-1-phosphate guanylyltransferase [Gemmatimonas sp.]|jgi:mannose-1-phosphate guanylyltransferase|uniref:mannose-1-phosphate guanylyltransferase n=1 Tax=Gemmatimonas sp. TaxID=1962908 RepID=UPI0037BEF556